MEFNSNYRNSARSDSTIAVSPVQIGLYIATILGVFMLDRITKLAALACFQTEKLFGHYLSCQLVINRGISWGILNSADALVYRSVFIVVVAVTLLLAWYSYKRAQEGYTIYGELMVLAGSLSNIVDRVYYNGVIDFISIQTSFWSWPVFNVADVAIVLGVLVICVQLTKQQPLKQPLKQL